MARAKIGRQPDKIIGRTRQPKSIQSLFSTPIHSDISIPVAIMRRSHRAPALSTVLHSAAWSMRGGAWRSVHIHEKFTWPGVD
ncbi:hypothetical protein CU102_10605 [Phyllobacterium brassicacearum]|uniref:Uncharacterized protein n=1 Tax=Phyllobacterium brassicacearum TaxID=314235 RepID=A0A2P7BQK2_9HYPH|nr:hypothetical protein CU102_10605 [Phyllobacterium brassicacearum]